jgi:hypothetical protein
MELNPVKTVTSKTTYTHRMEFDLATVLKALGIPENCSDIVIELPGTPSSQAQTINLPLKFGRIVATWETQEQETKNG